MLTEQWKGIIELTPVAVRRRKIEKVGRQSENSEKNALHPGGYVSTG